MVSFPPSLNDQLSAAVDTLLLLFLLAVAALPGALLPQRALNPGLVTSYYAAYPTIAPLLDKLGFFGVFAAP